MINLVCIISTTRNIYISIVSIMHMYIAYMYYVYKTYMHYEYTVPIYITYIINKYLNYIFIYSIYIYLFIYVCVFVCIHAFTHRQVESEVSFCVCVCSYMPDTDMGLKERTSPLKTSPEAAGKPQNTITGQFHMKVLLLNSLGLKFKTDCSYAELFSQKRAVVKQTWMQRKQMSGISQLT